MLIFPPLMFMIILFCAVSMAVSKPLYVANTYAAPTQARQLTTVKLQSTPGGLSGYPAYDPGSLGGALGGGLGGHGASAVMSVPHVGVVSRSTAPNLTGLKSAVSFFSLFKYFFLIHYLFTVFPCWYLLVFFVTFHLVTEFGWVFCIG